jgi:hypothetical protein
MPGEMEEPKMEHYVHGDVLVGFTIFAMVAGFTILFVLFFVLWCCCCPPMYGTQSWTELGILYLFN